jgi:hypothetical protein
MWCVTGDMHVLGMCLACDSHVMASLTPTDNTARGYRCGTQGDREGREDAGRRA